MELGEYVSKYRKEAGFSVDYLAEKSGVPKGTLNKIISGDTRSPTLETVIDIARALGKSLDDFLDNPPINKKNPVQYIYIKDETQQDTEEELAEQFEKLWESLKGYPQGQAALARILEIAARLRVNGE